MATKQHTTPPAGLRAQPRIPFPNGGDNFTTLPPSTHARSVEIPSHLDRRGRFLIALEVAGRWMEPEIPGGTCVLVDMLDSAAVGDTVAVVAPGRRLVLRKLAMQGGRMVLTTNNGHTYPIGGTRLVGVVVHVGGLHRSEGRD